MRSLALIALACVTAAGCSSGVQPDTGLRANMWVAGAQYFPGNAPAPSVNGPTVNSVGTNNSTIYPGENEFSVTGQVQDTASAVALQLDGDEGYWIVNSGIRNNLYPSYLDYAASASFAPTTPLGDRNLLVWGVSPQGVFGPTNMLTLHVQAARAALGNDVLAVQLTWDTESDLDLRLALPDGTVIWRKRPRSQGGSLDWDSNNQCQIDGQREESITWPAPAMTDGGVTDGGTVDAGTTPVTPPPSGHYVVRVDTFSLCDQVAADWHVVVTLNGATIAEAQGQSGPVDTQFPHDAAGDGLFATEFDVP